MGDNPHPHNGKKYHPTDEQRRHVMTMAGFGIRQEEIARMLEIDRKTLTKYFRRELDTGMTEANVRVAQALYSNAVKNMNVTAQIWWTKARMGWREKVDLNAAGAFSLNSLRIEFVEPPPQRLEEDARIGAAPIINGHAEPAHEPETFAVAFVDAEPQEEP